MKKVKNRNKKGFTLVELLAVILILGILIGLSTTAYINIRNNASESDYKNLQTYLETKASEYASKTGITSVTVEELIKAGVVKPDDETDIYNPVNDESINCYIITSNYNNGSYTSTFGGNLGKENGVCNPHETTADFQICKVVGEDCVTAGVSEWTNKDVVLKVKKGSEILTKSNGWNINWSSSDGSSGDESLRITAPMNSIKEASVKAEITDKTKLITGTAKEKVRIDKKAPIINNVKVGDEVNNKKQVQIEATDETGSGIKEYFVTKGNDKNNVVSWQKVSNLEKGIYYVWVVDRAGNESNISDEIKIVTSAEVPTKPVITASDGLASGTWHSNDFKLNFSSKYTGKESFSYYISTNPLNINTQNNGSLDVSKEENNITYYVKACVGGPKGRCSEVSSYAVNTDTEGPVINVKVIQTGNVINGYSKKVNLDISLADNRSGLDSYKIIRPNECVGDNKCKEDKEYYKISDSNKYEYYTTWENQSNSGDYIIYAKDKVGNISTKKIDVWQIDDEPPVIDSVYYTVTCTRDDFFITLNMKTHDEKSNNVKIFWNFKNIKDFANDVTIFTDKKHGYYNYKLGDNELKNATIMTRVVNNKGDRDYLKCNNRYNLVIVLMDEFENKTGNINITNEYNQPMIECNKCGSGSNCSAYDCPSSSGGSTKINPCSYKTTINDSWCNASDRCTMYQNAISWWVKGSNQKCYADANENLKYYYDEAGNKKTYDITRIGGTWYLSQKDGVVLDTELFTWCGFAPISIWFEDNNPSKGILKENVDLSKATSSCK